MRRGIISPMVAWLLSKRITNGKDVERWPLLYTVGKNANTVTVENSLEISLRNRKVGAELLLWCRLVRFLPFT